MKLPRCLPLLIIGLWAAWFVAVVAHGAGLTVFSTSRSFAEAGQFGDAFGSLASLMAALAAAGALLTLRQQQEQSALESFESNFFGLLDHFQNLVQITQAHNWAVQTDADGNENDIINHSFHGHQAFRAILDELRVSIRRPEFKVNEKIEKRYKAFYSDFQDDLGHYFRLMYHLFKMIDDRWPKNAERRYYYGQLIRAHLSNSESILVAYNCICGEGRHKFVSYLETFAVLHNVSFGTDAFGKAEMDFIKRNLPAEAFTSQSQVAEKQTLTSMRGGG